MAYPNDKFRDNRNQGGNYRNQGGNNRNQGGNNRNHHNDEATKPVPPFSDDYLDYADKLMGKYRNTITTSKLRSILSMLMDVYNTETLRTEDTISPESQVKLQMTRIRIVYECGRDERNKGFLEFVNDANLLSWLKETGDSRIRALRLVHYMEAIVAYHRYHGGKE